MNPGWPWCVTSSRPGYSVKKVFLKFRRTQRKRPELSKKELFSCEFREFFSYTSGGCFWCVIKPSLKYDFIKSFKISLMCCQSVATNLLHILTLNTTRQHIISADSSVYRYFLLDTKEGYHQQGVLGFWYFKVVKFFFHKDQTNKLIFM